MVAQKDKDNLRYLKRQVLCTVSVKACIKYTALVTRISFDWKWCKMKVLSLAIGF